MTELAVPSTGDVAFTRGAFDALSDQALSAIRNCQTADQANGTKAKVAMLKAWVKAHRAVQNLRQELLLLEVEALVRVIELRGDKHLSAAEVRAGKWLAEKSAAERMQFVADSGSATTAEGLCRAVWRAEEDTVRRAQATDLGRQWAAGERTTVRQAMHDVLDKAASIGQPFEVADVASQLVDSTGYDGDPDFMEGVLEMCRRALRSSQTDELDGTIIPKFVTSKLPDGSWVRVPTANATIADLTEMLLLRQQQLKADQAAYDRLCSFVARVQSYNPQPTDTVADVLRVSLHQSAA